VAAAYRKREAAHGLIELVFGAAQARAMHRALVLLLGAVVAQILERVVDLRGASIAPPRPRSSRRIRRA
jgi:hypothetical protein